MLEDLSEFHITECTVVNRLCFSFRALVEMVEYISIIMSSTSKCVIYSVAKGMLFRSAKAASNGAVFIDHTTGR